MVVYHLTLAKEIGLEDLTLRKNGPSWPGLKVVGTISYVPAVTSRPKTTNPDLKDSF